MKRIAVINDISGFGRCSLSAARPVISALGVQCCPLPTGIFSAQTGYGCFYHRSLTEDIRPVAESWKNMGASFNAVLSGFITDAKQGMEILEIMKCFKEKGSLAVVDPVMGDDGSIYPCYGDESISVVRLLAKTADVLTPNYTELCLLSGESPITVSSLDPEKLIEKVRILSESFADEGQTIITTGLELGGGEIGSAVFSGENFEVVRAKKYGGSFSGTGDVFTAVVTARIVSGNDVPSAVRLAAEFISKCAKATTERNPVYDRNEGIEFETMLKELTEI